ncbi:lipocalin family protein [Robiginitalea marina]|uniref:Lipocalin family protein n=1 Tax=Robiginitalea marina TaxID=2954105 RepID=A0ABT1B1A2_9FLAO|nr:lipocalin family protein [Robiginitalea marina]MCO5725630.1 lipocalin family protein [Robiginitalea marina]
MKLKYYLIALLTAAFFSCSSDDDADSGVNSIVGTWDAVSLQLDATATEEERNAATLFNLLAAQDCYLLTLIFTESQQATLESSFAYLDLSGLLTGDFNIACPTESDSETATYSYTGGQLTITDSEGMSETVTATLSGNRLTMQIEGDEFEEFGTGGSLIFERR